MPKFGEGSSRRRKGSNNGWRRPRKAPTKDTTRTPSPGSTAGSCYGLTTPLLSDIMRQPAVDQPAPPPKDLDPASGAFTVKGYAVRSMALRLWATTYGREHASEQEEYVRNGAYEKARALLANTAPSTYQQQNRSREAALSIREAKARAMRMGWCAKAAHQNNYRHIPFSMASRSIQHLGHKSSVRSWTEQFNVLARSTTVRLVNAMVAVRPACSFTPSCRIRVYFYDQVYRVKSCGAKKNKSTAQERITGAGTPALNSYAADTYINTVHLPVPIELPDLTQEDVTQLTAHGPYTGSWDQVYPMLSVSKVCA